MAKAQAAQRVGSFSSPLITLIAGLNRKYLCAHAAILSNLDILKASVDGNWKDGQERTVILEGWDEEKVAQLIEWLYSDQHHYSYTAAINENEIEVMALKQPNAQQTEMAKMMKEGTAEEAAREAKGPARRNLIPYASVSQQHQV